MRFGVHLPLADLGQGLPTGRELRTYTRVAAELGFSTVAANDHLVWRRPWLDGPTALAAVCGSVGPMTLATTVALPTVRHPVVLAKTLASLATIADAPVIAGLGPGSSAADHEAVGIPFEQRWARFDEGVQLIRALLRGETTTTGRFYSGEELHIDPSARSIEVWSASWGSAVRLPAVAGAADGWLASAYNTTPPRFRAVRTRLDAHLTAAGRDPAAFGDLLVTMWLYITHDRAAARRVLEDVLAPLLDRDAEQLATQLPVGSPEHCVELLDSYAAVGARQVLLWPVSEPVKQLELFSEHVRPHVDHRPTT